jgi:hypothetical protein
MNLKTLRKAVSLRGSANPADSLEALIKIPLVHNDSHRSAAFGRTHTKSGQFIDTFTFGTLPMRAKANASLLHLNLMPAQNMHFVGASLSGHPFDFFASLSSMGGMLWTVPVEGELVLTVWGTVGQGEGNESCASYSGVLNIAPDESSEDANEASMPTGLAESAAAAGPAMGSRPVRSK